MCDALDFTFVKGKRGNGMWLYFIFHGQYIQESTSLLSSSQSPGLGQVIIRGFKEGEAKAGDAFNIEDTKSGDALNI